MVVVRCLVYNHEAYLDQCLRGFFIQETDFPFEVFVHDDASTDGSADIIRRYAEKYPKILKPVYETENQYSKKDGSFYRAMWDPVLQGGHKYIALCEGDDYWTDPKKLQKQVEYMEGHPGCAMTFHHHWASWEDGEVPPEARIPERPDKNGRWPVVTFRDALLQQGVFPDTRTRMVRRAIMAGFPPDWGKGVVLGDWLMLVHVVARGSVEYVPGIGPSVYRRHGGGAWGRQNGARKAMMHVRSEMAYYDHLEIDRRTRRKLLAKTAEEAMRAFLDPMSVSEGEWSRFAEECRQFGERHAGFRRECRKVLLPWGGGGAALGRLRWHYYKRCLAGFIKRFSGKNERKGREG
jgi:glycosyltransferase involved in cell wall biosynthesis